MYTQKEEEYDILGIGFGPAGLALSIALSDTDLLSTTRAKFIEKQPSFLWHGGMLLPNTQMQISFLKDLATLRTPTSEYTFVSYLHEKGRLSSFVNLGRWEPLRVEFNDYLSWAAKKIAGAKEGIVDYGEEVVGVEPVFDGHNRQVAKLRVTAFDRETNNATTRTTNTLIISLGGQPNVPSFVPEALVPAVKSGSHPRIAHSSQYTYRVRHLLPDATKPYRIAVIGSGQSAAELFVNLSSSYSNASVNLIYRDTYLRPSDASPFVNEVFDPEARDGFYGMEHHERQGVLIRERATNYSVVNGGLLEEIYGMMYEQKVMGGNRLELLHGSKVLSLRDDTEQGKVILELSRSTGTESNEKAYDAVFLATGYERNSHLTLLKNLTPYLQTTADGSLAIGRDYRLKTTPEMSSVGIYLQGACEATHGLSDTLLSVLSVRAGEVVDSIRSNMNRIKSRPYTRQTNSLLPTPSPSPTRLDSGVSLSDSAISLDPIPPPPKPSNPILLSTHIPTLNQTLTLRIANESDIPLLTTWHNSPRVSKFWNETGDESHHKTYLTSQLSCPWSIPVIGELDNIPFGYFEIYWAAHSNLAPHYKADSYDRGIHMLIGSEHHRGSHRVAAWLPALVRYCFESCERTMRVVSEPRSDNGKMVGYLAKHGFEFRKEIRLPHKVACFMVCEREEWADEGRDMCCGRE